MDANYTCVEARQPSVAEGWSFPIFATCCIRCLDLFKNVCHMPRP